MDNEESEMPETGFEGEESILELDETAAEEENSDDTTEVNPTLTFQVYHHHIRNKFDGLSAMQQAVDKILYTERFVYPIYSDQYGNDLPDLIGKNINYAIVEVERMIVEALTNDDRVTGVEIEKIAKVDRDALSVQGVCHTVFGDIAIDKEVNLKNESN